MIANSAPQNWVGPAVVALILVLVGLLVWMGSKRR